MTIQIIEKRMLTYTKLALMLPGILMFTYFFYLSISEWYTRPEMHFLLIWGFFLIISISGFIIALRNMILKRAKYIFYEDKYRVTQTKKPFAVKYDVITKVTYNSRTKYIKFTLDKYKKKGNFKFWFLMGNTLQFSLNDATTTQIEEIMENFSKLNKEIICIDKYIFWQRVFAFLL